MKFLLLLLVGGICIPTLGHSQFRTIHTPNGDPVTEIIDESAMRQGTWNYYNSVTTLVRQETYENHLLLSRIHFISNQEVNTLEYAENQLFFAGQITTEVQAMLAQTSGEVVVNEQGEIVLIEFYELESTSDIKHYTSIIEKAVGTQKGAILLF
jgi:hypothetical protein